MGTRHKPIDLEQAIQNAFVSVEKPDNDRLRAILRQVEATADTREAKRTARWLPLLLLGAAAAAAAVIAYQRVMHEQEQVVTDISVNTPAAADTSVPPLPGVVMPHQEDEMSNREKAGDPAQQPSRPKIIYLR